MELVFATHNTNKLKEVKELFPQNITLLSLTDIGCHEEIPETGTTLEANALIKANYVFNKYNLPCFADDTGLLVDALNGAPGVYSARYAGEHRNSEDNMDKLLTALDGAEHRAAHFQTVIALNLHMEQHFFHGKVDGVIIHEKKGKNGFGYDPIFKPNGYDQTFAKLPLSIKNEIGHRGKAIAKLAFFLKENIYAEK